MKNDFWSCLMDYLLFFGIICCAGLIFALMAELAAPDYPIEAETYTVGCEISNMDIIVNSSSIRKYIISVRNDEFAATVDVDAKTYAKYTEGEIVEVKVTVKENKDGTEQKNFYKLAEEGS